MSREVVVVEYYTDVLCVWAWIAQRRIDELEQELGSRITLHRHYIDLFGDTATRIEEQWGERGSYAGFGDHVIESAAPFEDAPINPDIWRNVRPASSADAHLYIQAAGLAGGTELAVDFALAIRRAFFVDARDIGTRTVLRDIAAESNLPLDRLDEVIADGRAMARLMADYQRARNQDIKGSPSYVLNEGRQVLYGNVGYRVLAANIEELLKRPQGEASWC